MLLICVWGGMALAALLGNRFASHPWIRSASHWFKHSSICHPLLWFPNNGINFFTEVLVELPKEKSRLHHEALVSFKQLIKYVYSCRQFVFYFKLSGSSWHFFPLIEISNIHKGWLRIEVKQADPVIFKSVPSCLSDIHHIKRWGNLENL